MKHLAPLLAALVLLPACQSSSSSGDGGDAGTDSDTDTDVDTDSDTDTDTDTDSDSDTDTDTDTDTDSDTGTDLGCDELEPCDELFNCADAGPGVDCYNLTEACGENLCCTEEEACWVACEQLDCIILDTDPAIPDCGE